jgi:hypothetical protein
MAVRIFPQLSPRVAVIQKPDTTRSVQIITDELKNIEDEPSFLTYPFLVLTAGKEDLGGGTEVGITATLQNSVVAFEQRGISISQGTITTGGTSRLIDSAATFITDGVIPGAAIINFTDQCVGTVGRIISETEIELITDLEDGTDNDFDIGDIYKIWNIIQVEIDGGNLVAIDDLGATIPSIFPTFGTQVLKTGSSSATIKGVDNIANIVWDEILTGSTHNIQNSAGKRLRDIASQAIHTDTARGSGIGSNQIQFALAASSVDGAFDPSMVTIIDGTGNGQTRLIYQYDGATRTATVDRNWKVLPDVTSEYIVFAHPGREHVNEGLAQGGTSNTITLNNLASSTDDVYNAQTIFLRSGIGEDQTALVKSYNGTTKVATIFGIWGIIPNGTTAYVMLPTHDDLTTEQFASFDGVVSIDAVNGVPGTDYPIGTRRLRSNNITDAATIASNNGLMTFEVSETLVIGASDAIDGFSFIGDNAFSSVMVLIAGCTTEKTIFRNMIVTGAVNGSVFMERVGLQTLSNIGADTFPFNGSDSPVAFRRYAGGISISNYTAGQQSTFEFNQGQFIIDATCTSGTVQLCGIYQLTDSGTLTINKRDRSIGEAVWDTLEADHIIADTMGVAASTVRKVSINKMFVDKILKTLTIFDDDGTTPLFVFDLEDAVGGTEIAPTNVGIFKKTPQ